MAMDTMVIVEAPGVHVVIEEDNLGQGGQRERERERVSTYKGTNPIVTSPS